MAVIEFIIEILAEIFIEFLFKGVILGFLRLIKKAFNFIKNTFI